MARLSDLHAASRTRLSELDCPTYADRPWVQPPALEQSRIAMISSAALVRRGDPLFLPNDTGWRPLPHALPDSELLISHVSINFDRTGLQQDLEVALPRRHLDRLAETGVIGAVGTTHYSFMGSNDPKVLDQTARDIAGRLKAECIDAAILVPV